jgi:hypothetical protein
MLEPDFKFRSFSGVEVPAMKLRQHKRTFEERLEEEARRFKQEAETLSPGSRAREMLLLRARQAETASHINGWLSSPGLASPK